MNTTYRISIDRRAPTMVDSPFGSSADPAAAFDTGIPETFTAAQAEWVIAWNEAAGNAGTGVALQLDASTPTRFSAAQAECIRELLNLNAQDFRATLADAMEPCPLRNRLRARARRVS